MSCPVPVEGDFSGANASAAEPPLVYSVSHRTHYDYPSPVLISHHLLHLEPRPSDRQRLLDFSIEIAPTPTTLNRHVDYYGNIANFVAVEGAHKAFTVVCKSRIELTPSRWPDHAATPPWESVRELWWNEVSGAPDANESGEFRFDSPYIRTSAAFAEFAARSFQPKRPLLEAVCDLIRRIATEFKFDPRATTTATPVEQVLKQRSGVCQDFAHLGIACLRSIGLPARYVSGYLETSPPPGQKRLVGADASHAWFAVWCPDIGWIDADPTNNRLCDHRHLTVAWGRDFSDVSPLRGIVLGGGEHDVEVAVDVIREGDGEADAEGDAPADGSDSSEPPNLETTADEDL